MMQCWQNTAGFTLIEMMITVAIIAIVTAIAYPSMQKQIAQQRVIEAVNMTENTFRQARAQAIINHTDIKVFINNNKQTIEVTPDGSTVPVSQTYNSKITITSVNDMPMIVKFTTDKHVKQGDTLLATDLTKGYGFCYTNVPTDKYLITVDAMTNIRVEKKGVCS